MTIQQLKDVHRTEPFQPFTLYLADGGKIIVSHAESIAYNPSGGRTVVVVSPDDTTQFIDRLLVSRIERTNGARDN